MEIRVIYNAFFDEALMEVIRENQLSNAFIAGPIADVEMAERYQSLNQSLMFEEPTVIAYSSCASFQFDAHALRKCIQDIGAMSAEPDFDSTEVSNLLKFLHLLNEGKPVVITADGAQSLIDDVVISSAVLDIYPESRRFVRVFLRALDTAITEETFAIFIP